MGSRASATRQELAVRERPSAPARRGSRRDEEGTTFARRGLTIGSIAIPDPADVPITGGTLFSIALFLHLFGMVLYRSMISVIAGFKMWPFLAIICLLLVVSEYLTTGFDYSRVELAVLGVGLGLAGLVTVFTRDAVVAVTFLIMLTARRHSFDRVCRTAILAFSAGLAIVLILGAVGAIENHVWHQGGGRTRYGLGFKYVSYPSLYVWFLSVAVFCRFRGRVPKPLAVALAIFAVFLFRSTDARLPMVLTVLLMAASFVDWDALYLRDEAAMLIGNASAIVFLVMVVVSVLLMIGYESIQFDLLLRFDDVLGHRILISNRAFKEFGVSLLGQDIEMVGQGLTAEGEYLAQSEAITFIDNSYCNVLVKYGIVVFGLVVLGYAVLLWLLAQKQAWPILLSVALILLQGLIANVAAIGSFNIVFFLLGTELLGSLSAFEPQASVPEGNGSSIRRRNRR